MRDTDNKQQLRHRHNHFIHRSSTQHNTTQRRVKGLEPVSGWAQIHEEVKGSDQTHKYVFTWFLNLFLFVLFLLKCLRFSWIKGDDTYFFTFSMANKQS